MDVKYQAFMAHIPKDKWSQTHSHLVKWLPPDRKYLIVGESTPYEHLHYLVEMTPKEYKNYANLTFKQKYNLRGRAVAGKSRQYGKVKEIRDIERMQAYMIKDSLEYNVNCFTNISKDKLKLLKETISYKKTEKYPYKIFINYLKSNDVSQRRSFGQLTKNVLTIKILATTWLQVTKTRLPSKDSLIYYAYQAGRISELQYIKQKYHFAEEIL